MNEIDPHHYQEQNQFYDKTPSYYDTNFLNIEDIEGARSKKLFQGKPKNIMDKYSGIEESRPK